MMLQFQSAIMLMEPLMANKPHVPVYNPSCRSGFFFFLIWKKDILDLQYHITFRLT